MEVTNFIKGVRENSWASHLVLETIGDVHPDMDYDKVFGGDKDNFKLEIMINDTKLDAEKFLVALEKNYESWYTDIEKEMQKGVEKYIEEKKVRINDKVDDLFEVLESLKNKIDCLDDSITWDDKLLKEISSDVERRVKQVTNVRLQGEGLLDRNVGTPEVE